MGSRNIFHNVSAIKTLLRLYLCLCVCVCACQSVLIKSRECERRGCYSSSLTGFSHRFSDSSIIIALLWNLYVCLCMWGRMSVMGLMTMKWGVSEYFLFLFLIFCYVKKHEKTFIKNRDGNKGSHLQCHSLIRSKFFNWHSYCSSIPLSGCGCQSAITLTLTLTVQLHIENILRPPDTTYGPLSVPSVCLVVRCLKQL